MVMGYPEYSPKHARPELVPPPVEPPVEEKASMFDKILGANWKAIIGFAAAFGSQLVARAFSNGEAVLPTDAKGWAALIGGSLLAGGLVWLKGNTESVDSLQRKLDKAAAK